MGPWRFFSIGRMAFDPSRAGTDQVDAGYRVDWDESAGKSDAFLQSVSGDVPPEVPVGSSTALMSDGSNSFVFLPSTAVVYGADHPIATVLICSAGRGQGPKWVRLGSESQSALRPLSPRSGPLFEP